MERFLSRWLVGAALVCGGASAQAAEPSPLVIEGPRVIEMVVGKGGHEGSISVKNTGGQPVLVKARLLDSESDVRLPRGVSIQFDNRLEQLTLAPGESKKATVRWVPSSSKAREVYGHVVFEAGATAPVHAGLHGELGGGVVAQLSRHALSVLLALPLLGAIAALVSRVAGRAARQAVTGVAAANLGLALWVVAALDRDFGRSDGNEGLQFIERQRALGLDLFVGADGASASVVVLIAAAWLMAAAVEVDAVALALGAIAASGLSLAALSQDLGLLWLGLAAGLGASSAQAARAGQGKALGALSGLALALAGLAFWGLSGAVDAPLLADGDAAGRCASLPSILRSDHLAAGRSLLGLPLAAGAFAALAAGLLPLAGLWPLGAWMQGPLRASGARLVSLSIPMVLLYTLTRVGALATPEGVGWAAPALSWGGAAAAAFGALAALGERDGIRRAGWLAALQVGAAMVGLGAGTPQGLQGCLCAGVALSLGLLMSSEPARGATPWSPRLGDLVLGGVPGFFGFWGLAWAASGALPLRWAPGLVVAAAWCCGVAAALRGEREGQAGEARPWGVGFGAAALVLGLLPGLLLGGERWSLDLAAFLSPPGPAQVASK